MIAAGTHLGRYELLRLLSAGGMGEVFLARQTSTVEGFATLAAIKVLLTNLSRNKAVVQMFLDEARIVGRLHHKNIVQVRDIAEHEGQYYMVMEYIPGQTLRELLGDASIQDRPLFEPRLGCEIFAELASALAAAHGAGLVHRDVSPNNIMISDEGIPKLIDFGVARAMGSASLTTPGTLKGKFGYMAPEYVRSQAYDARVDLFSLGVVMWETFARRRLFRGTSAAEQVHQLLESEIVRLDVLNPTIPSELADLVQSALERDPQRRMPSAMVLSESLSALAQSLPVGPDSTLRRWLERRIPGRMEERSRTDQLLVSLPPGSPIPDFGPAVAPDVASVPGTYGYQQMEVSGGGFGAPASGSQSGQRASQSGFGGFAGSGSGSQRGGSGNSLRMAAGEYAPAPEAALPPAPAQHRGLLFGAIGAAVALAGVLIFSRVLGPSQAPLPPAVASDAPVAGSGELSLAEAHRQIGLKAMADGDYKKAKSEYAEALRAGGDAELLELMKMASQLEAEEAQRAAKPASPEAPTVATEDQPAQHEPARTAVATVPAAPATERTESTGDRTTRTTRKEPARRQVAVTRPKPGADRPSPEAARPAPTPPPPPVPTQGDVVITSITPKATVLIDGNTVGQTPLRVPLPAGEHRLVVKTGTHQLEARTITVTGGETARVHVEATPPPVTAAKPEPVAPPPPPPPPEKPRLAPTPRVTATGDATQGARVIAACNSCHAREGAGAVSGRKYTRAQWDRFFASGQHDRYLPIGNQMNAAQLAAAKAFLRTKAADAPENQGAGIRE